MMKTYRCPSCFNNYFESEYRLKVHIKRVHLDILRYRHTSEASRIYDRWAGGDNTYEEMIDEIDEMGYKVVTTW